MVAFANRVESFDVLVAAGTAQAAAVTTDCTFQDGVLVRLELDVPDGHAGLTGIQILSAKGQMIPYTAGTFLVANDHQFGWDLVGQIDTGSFQVKAFNTDIYPHTFHVRFSVLDFAQIPASPAPPAAIPTPLLV
jgi:hypothetical protein